MPTTTPTRTPAKTPARHQALDTLLAEASSSPDPNKALVLAPHGDTASRSDSPPRSCPHLEGVVFKSDVCSNLLTPKEVGFLVTHAGELESHIIRLHLPPGRRPGHKRAFPISFRYFPLRSNELIAFRFDMGPLLAPQSLDDVFDRMCDVEISEEDSHPSPGWAENVLTSFAEQDLVSRAQCNNGIAEIQRATLTLEPTRSDKDRHEDDDAMSDEAPVDAVWPKRANSDCQMVSQPSRRCPCSVPKYKPFTRNQRAALKVADFLRL